jgi:DeoR family transcriptional regulator, galactitol utilization operon repressor
MIQNLSEREKSILDLLCENSDSSVSRLSEILKVSHVTIRNDLNSLAEKGLIIRTRGGAFPAFHPDIMERQRTKNAEKSRIAKAAADMIEDGDTVMIEAGTTTALICRYLYGKRDVRIVTNSTLTLPMGRTNPSIRLTLVGGEFRASTESVVGPIALEELKRFHVGCAFVGTDGFSLAAGLTTHLIEGAEIVKMMANQADKTVLVADKTKYGRRGFVQVLPLESMHTIITDSDFPEEEKQVLQEQGVTIKIADLKLRS